MEEKLIEGKMQGEEVVLNEEGDSPMAEAEFPVAMMKETVRKWQRQQTKRVTLGDEGRTSEVEVMEEVEEMPTSVTSSTHRGTNHLNFLKAIRQGKEGKMLLSLRRLRSHLKKWRTCLK